LSFRRRPSFRPRRPRYRRRRWRLIRLTLLGRSFRPGRRHRERGSCTPPSRSPRD